MGKRLVRVIEDEIEIAEIIRDVLTARGYQVELFHNFEQYKERTNKDIKALYLVDWNLPDRPGIEIVEDIRKSDKVSPIFIVSAYSRSEDILRGLKIGADDYITKPFHYEELLARVKNAWEKFSAVLSGDNGEDVQLLPEAHSLRKDGKTFALTNREYIIFDFLYSKRGEAVSRDDLMEQFDKGEMTPRNIDVHVFSLRKKIKESNMVISTVWGIGYKLVV